MALVCNFVKLFIWYYSWKNNSKCPSQLSLIKSIICFRIFWCRLFTVTKIYRFRKGDKRSNLKIITEAMTVVQPFFTFMICSSSWLIHLMSSDASMRYSTSLHFCQLGSFECWAIVKFSVLILLTFRLPSLSTGGMFSSCLGIFDDIEKVETASHVISSAHFVSITKRL